MMAGAMPLPSMSDSDCVAKMTLAFFLRSVFSHSRSCRRSPRRRARASLVDDESVGEPSSRSLDAVEEIGEHGGAAGADQPSISNACTDAEPRCSASRRAAAHRARRRIWSQRLLQVVGLEQDGRPVMVRSSTGGGQRGQRRPEVLLHLGVIATPSRIRIATIQSAAQRSGVS
jgi:hypothetical protein